MNNDIFRYIGPRPGSSYCQHFLNGSRTRAETIYRYVIGPDAQSPEQVAADCNLPIEAVYECIRYCERNADLVRAEATADWENIASRGLLDGKFPHASAQSK
jgi:uncharacterized protein (DUF433 family)